MLINDKKFLPNPVLKNVTLHVTDARLFSAFQIHSVTRVSRSSESAR